MTAAAPNWLEISTPALAANYRSIQLAAGADTAVLAVIKADAYGHGALACAPVLARAGAPWLGVTCASEGARIRQVLAAQHLVPEILLMSGSFAADRELIGAHGLTPIVWTEEQLDWLAAGATSGPGATRDGGGAPIRIHVEIDTGMSRQGVAPGQPLRALLERLRGLAGLKLTGLCTHLSSAEEAPARRTLGQRRLFEQAVGQVAAGGLTVDWLHVGNTSAVDNPALDDPRDPAGDAWLATQAARLGATPMVRTGLALYGYCLPVEPPGAARLAPRVTPVLTWQAHLLSVRDLGAGESVGYNATFTAQRPMRIALIPAGYADGLRRELSSTSEAPGGWVMLHGRRAPILGRVSMNLTVVDVTAIAEAAAGDAVTLLGPGITAEDHARLAGTIPYEILCGLHPCV